ncbi:MAG: hypothetical protein M3Z35_11970 [Nitrospirota bacterium]|nr:hypothetical protein [Nitrospirota bacterium]
MPKRIAPPAVFAIENEFTSADHYLQLLERFERSAQEADTGCDLAALEEAKASFRRELSSFLNAARTGKNYLTAGADSSGHRKWLNERINDPIYKFHADLAGTIFHENAISLSRHFSVSIFMTPEKKPAEFQVKRSVDGSFGLQSLSDHAQVLPMRLIYNTSDLTENLVRLLTNISMHPQPIVVLAADYLRGLQQTLKNALRKGRL